MSKKKTSKVSSQPAVASVLTQRDADEYRIALKKYSKNVTSSKKKAQQLLWTLGTHTSTGKVSKKYG
jgi:hypothetical protein